MDILIMCLRLHDRIDVESSIVPTCLDRLRVMLTVPS